MGQGSPRAFSPGHKRRRGCAVDYQCRRPLALGRMRRPLVGMRVGEWIDGDHLGFDCTGLNAQRVVIQTVILINSSYRNMELGRL